MNSGLIGGIIGSIIGLSGGIIGSYFSIKNTKTAKEKAFMIKTNIIGWLAVILFLSLMFLLPIHLRFWLWIPYSILLPLGIFWSNRTQQKIRKE